MNLITHSFKISIDIDCIFDKCYKDCHYKYFHTFEYECVNNLNFTKNTNNEIVTLTISGKNLGLYELNKKLTLARERGCIFNQINNFEIEIYSILSCINIDYRFKQRTPFPLHYQFFINLLKNRD